MSDQEFHARVDAMLSGAMENPPGSEDSCPGPPITTGKTGLGLRWAQLGSWRVMAYASVGYACQRWDDRARMFFCLLPSEQMPAGVEQRLCAALGITYQTDEPAACNFCGGELVRPDTDNTCAECAGETFDRR